LSSFVFMICKNNHEKAADFMACKGIYTKFIGLVKMPLYDFSENFVAGF